MALHPGPILYHIFPNWACGFVKKPWKFFRMIDAGIWEEMHYTWRNRLTYYSKMWKTPNHKDIPGIPQQNYIRASIKKTLKNAKQYLHGTPRGI